MPKTTTKQGKRKYMKPYMKQYRQFIKERNKKLAEAIEKGNLDVAKQLLSKKPSIKVGSLKNG